MPKRQQQRSNFDTPWKEALDYFLAAFLKLFFPRVFDDIDWSRGYESLDKELHQIVRSARTRKALADKLFKVWRRGGKETWLLIHVEVQGKPEEDFPLRMFRYNTRAFDRYNRAVVSMAVLTDERDDWRPERFEYGNWDASTSIRFPITKLIDGRGREAELEASTNPFAHVVLAHLRAIETRSDPKGRQNYKVQLVKGLSNRGWTTEEVRQLFRVIDWLMDLPRELQQGFQEELFAWEEGMRRPYITSVERSGMEKGLRAGIRVALLLKFKKIDKRLLTKVEAVHDVDDLQELLEAIPKAESIQAFRALLSDFGDSA